MKIIIGSEGMGSWGKDVINFFINKVNPSIEIKYENTSECNIVVKSLFPMIEEEWNKEQKVNLVSIKNP